MPINSNAPTLREALEADRGFQHEVNSAQAGSSEWLSAEAAAKYLNKTVRHVRRYQAAGKLPTRRKVGRERRFSREEVEALKRD